MREYKLIAHRGSHKFAKENSLFSFFNAINENYYGFECDVRQSKDKKFYIYVYFQCEFDFHYQIL